MRGGINADADFSAKGDHQTTDIHLVSFELSQELGRDILTLDDRF
jgi:hypothetical protein